MGIRAYAKRITRVQLADLQRDPMQIKNLLHIGYAWSYAADLLLEKDWHVIHFLLTGDTEPGISPLHNAVLGGTLLPRVGRFFPHDPPRFLTPEEVKLVSLALRQVPMPEMLSRFSDITAAKVDVYAAHFQRDDWDDLAALIEELMDFFDESARRGCAVLHYMA